jgi:hypothetical protein
MRVVDRATVGQRGRKGFGCRNRSAFAGSIRRSRGRRRTTAGTAAIVALLLMLPGCAAPQAQSAIVITVNRPTPITLTATAPPDAVLTFTISTPPAHGTVTGTGPNVAYTPVAGFLGSDSFAFTVSDAPASRAPQR